MSFESECFLHNLESTVNITSCLSVHSIAHILSRPGIRAHERRLYFSFNARKYMNHECNYSSLHSFRIVHRR